MQIQLREVSYLLDQCYGVYPNPFADKVQVNVVAESIQKVEVRLLDYVGRTVRTLSFTAQPGSNNFTVGQLSGL